MIIGLLGLGEVGTAYGLGMVREGATIKGYDIRFENTNVMPLFDRCKDGGISLSKTPQELIEGCDLIMANTTSHASVSTAEMAKPFLKPGQIYIDGNSAIPTVKHEIDALLKGCCEFVDGCTMNNPTQLGTKCPVVVSGPMAQKAADILNSYGMNTICLGDQIGQASALKCIRSIFTKSFASSFMECMLMAHKYGISGPMLDSIVDYLEKDPPRETLETIIVTQVLHAKRQAQEVESVSLLELDEGMDNTMAAAAAKKLYYNASLGMREKFHDRVAPNTKVVLDEMLKVYLKKD